MAQRKKRQNFTGRTVQGKVDASSMQYVSGKIGTGIKRILLDEFRFACEAKGGRIHAKAWAGKKVMPLIKAWGLIVFFSFKRFQ
jgi:hypothetical protein